MRTQLSNMVEVIMKMLEREDAETFRKLGFNFAVIVGVAFALIALSMYFS